MGDSANRVYFNGSHAIYSSLSVYFRGDDRNNQALEVAQKGLLQEIPILIVLRWLNVAKKEEVV